MINGLNVASVNFAEEFVPIPEALVVPRQESVQLGADLPSGGLLTALTFMAKAVDAKAVVEIGTGSGVSGLALFAGMNPEGILTSIDTEVDRQAAARQAFINLDIPNRRFRLINGVALEVLPKLQDGSYDLVYINGDKLEYVEYVDQAMRLLRHGGIIVLDHALWQGVLVDDSNEDDETVIIREAIQVIYEAEELTKLLIPLGDGILVAIKE